MAEGFKGFYIYRPPKPTNRLEGEHHVDLHKWAPSVHYNKKLDDIEQQLTPSEAYKLHLQTVKKQERMFAKMKAKWLQHPAYYNGCARRIQKVYRGIVSRRRFYKIKQKLLREKVLRDTRIGMDEAWQQRDWRTALNLLQGCMDPPLDLKENACRILYAAGEFDLCERQCKSLLDEDDENLDAQYTLASIKAHQGLHEETYEILKTMINLNGPSPNASKLMAYTCMKLIPPKLSQAKLNMDFLVENDESDMNMLLQRACILSHMQDWEPAIADLTLVLYYEPHLLQVRLIRARAYACARKWKEAEDDYKYILKHDPENWWAQSGMADIIQDYNELPMVDYSVVNGDD